MRDKRYKWYKWHKFTVSWWCGILACYWSLGIGAHTSTPKPPDETDILLAQAHRYFDAARYDEALPLYKEFAAKNPDHLQVHLFIGDCYKAKQEYDLAMAEYRAVMDSVVEFGAREKSQLYAAVGDLYLKKKEIETALEYFDQALDMNPDEKLAYDVAQVFFADNEIRGSLRYFKRATEIKPGWGDPYLKLGYIYLNSGDSAAAVSSFERYLELCPGTVQAEEIRELIKKLSKTLD